jgi:SMI1 / KNR4 family (SUKH-1)/Ankyrin repeats (3 copies)
VQVRIIESNQFGKLRIADLESFEQSLGTRLPEPYRLYLLEHNGGHVDGAPQIAEGGFYGIHGGPEWSRFPDLSQIRSGGFPEHLLPIADDPCGNYTCIVLSGPNRGAVCFWDHECGPNASDGVKLLTRNFDSYLRGVAIKVALDREQSDVIRNAANEVGVNEPVYAGKTILDLAFELADFSIVEMLVLMGGNIRPDALIEAVRNDSLDTIRFLLERGINVNCVIPETGFTALMLAGSGKKIEVMELLKTHGANPTLRNRWGKTAADLLAGNWQGNFS